MNFKASACCIAVLGAAVFPAPVLSQQVCQSLLQGGIFDTNVTTDDTFAADYFRSRFCSSSSSGSSGGLDIGIPIEGVPVEFGANYGSTNSNNICDDHASSSEAWSKYRNWSSKASPVIAKAFVDCVKAEGTQLWTERSQVTNSFSLNARVHYNTKNFPPTNLQFSFSPSDIVGKCGPKSKTQLEAGVKVGNLETFRIVCELNSHSQGAEIGLIASSQIPYGSMSIRPYRPSPVFAFSTDTSDRDGVKTPNSGDATIGYGSDTLLDRYDGPKNIPPVSGRSWAAWNLDNITPGIYQVFVTYAAAESRPLRLLLDGRVSLTNIASEPTGLWPIEGWKAASRQQRAAGEVRIDKSNVQLRLEAMNPGQSWPHFKELRLVFVRD